MVFTSSAVTNCHTFVDPFPERSVLYGLYAVQDDERKSVRITWGFDR